jgi:hypothetical protein
MSNRLSSPKWCLALAVWALCGLMVCSAQTGRRERGRSIEFSNPRSDEISTNLHQLNSKKDSLKQLDEDFYRAFKTFLGGSSLDAVAAPPMTPPQAPKGPSKRVKELLERRKNAFLLTPEDLAPAPTAEEIFKIPEYDSDGVEKTKKTPMELYWERMDAKRAASLKPNRSEDKEASDLFGAPASRDSSKSREESDLPPGLKAREETLRQLFNPGAADAGLMPAPSARPNAFSDIFGLGETAPSREKALEHKKRMDEFNSLFDSGRPAPLNAGVPGTPGSRSDSLARPATAVGLPDTATGNNQLGKLNPVFSPASPVDVNAQLAGSSSLTPVLPKIEVPKAPPAPTFSAPRRPF